MRDNATCPQIAAGIPARIERQNKLRMPSTRLQIASPDFLGGDAEVGNGGGNPGGSFILLTSPLPDYRVGRCHTSQMGLRSNAGLPLRLCRLQTVSSGIGRLESNSCVRSHSGLKSRDI